MNKRVPATTMYGVVLTGLAGLIVGWLTGVWALHRYHRHGPRRRRLIRAAARPFFPAATLVLLTTATFVFADFADGVDQADIQAPLAFAGVGGPPTGLSVICVLLGLTAIVLTALPGVPRDTTTDGSLHQAGQAPA